MFMEELGFEAAALLDRLMRGEKAPKQPILISPRGLVVRRSTDVLAINHEPCRRAMRFLQLNLMRNIGVEDVAQATEELEAKGYRLLVKNKTEPWGQVVTRFLAPEGLLIGLTFTPWMREKK